MIFDRKAVLLDQVWEKAGSIPGLDPEFFRKDNQGAVICKNEFNNQTSIYGWCLNHLKPIWEGGNNELGNVVPLNCTNKILSLAIKFNSFDEGSGIWD